ncbi:MAG: hypothetical protein Q8O88_04075 [bacterium]|nr:hypothetical protein [bacterium]
MLLKKVTLNEEIDRMRVLAGVTAAEQQVLEEGIMSNVAAILGIAVSSLSSVFAQTGNLDKLNYSVDKTAALEHAMTDVNVVKKLHNLGVKDNNIKRGIDYAKGKEITGYQEKTAHSERELKTLIKAGWHLTSAQIDTIITKLKTEHPDVVVDTVFFNLNDGTMFASGKFVLDEIDKSNIIRILDSIEKSNSILLNVTIMSSTDKQGLSPVLQQTLISLGYSADNKGLSTARNDGVANVLSSVGVDVSLINKEALFERGGPIIDQSARYVKVAFSTVKYPTPIPLEKDSTISSVKSTYELFKPLFKYGTINVGKYKPNVCRTKIQTYTKKAVEIKCMFQQSK